MNGDGTQGNPYQITTFMELLAYAHNDSSTKRYLKIMNDINLSGEYTNGILTDSIICRSIDLDGNGKKISNWNKQTGYTFVVADGVGNESIHDLEFNNINLPATADHFMRGNGVTDLFKNCIFRGQIAKPFLKNLTDHENCHVEFNSCNFYIKDIRTGTNNLFDDATNHVNLKSCYFQYESTVSGPVFAAWWNQSYQAGIDSAFEMKLPNYTQGTLGNEEDVYFTNCTLDITTNASLTINGNSEMISIFNSTHAPNASGTNAAGISDENWLNTTVLAEAGFNVVT